MGSGDDVGHDNIIVVSLVALLLLWCGSFVELVAVFFLAVAGVLSGS